MSNNYLINKKAQATIFVIIAIVLVLGISLVFIFRDSIFGYNVPQKLSPVYDYYSGCIEQATNDGLQILGTQGGKIFFDDYQEGSAYSPFSSHLNFAGNLIRYWYGVTANGFVQSNVPSKAEMERELSQFIGQRLDQCDLTQFSSQGFVIELGARDISVGIQDTQVNVDVKSNLVVSLEDISFQKSSHKVTVSSKIGEYYNTAKAFYDQEMNTLILEAYATDWLRLYAPVDGVEPRCSPMIWKTSEVVSQLKEAVSANTAALRVKDPSNLGTSPSDEYFTIPFTSGSNMRFIYLKDWPSKVEVTPASQDLMIAEPLGGQTVAGIAGFCSVPYHFIYDVSFPVLVQISDGDELFQFPIVVVVDNNLPRLANLSVLTEEDTDFDLCEYKTNEVTVSTYDANLDPLRANISYQCFDQVCSLGQTELDDVGARLNTRLPACTNGQLIAQSEGYSIIKQVYSSNSESAADLILDREYSVNVSVRLGGQLISGERAIVHFTNQVGTKSAIVPEQTSVALSEGIYNVSVYVYGDSGIVIPASSKTQCYNTAKSGLLGLFGGTKEECVNVDVPETRIDYALLGGGKTNTYLLASELDKGNLIIDASELVRPDSLEQLQYNLEAFDILGVDIHSE